MDFYTTQHICELFKVSHQTVKNWADEFANYLSPTATPEGGKKRMFTLDDTSVFALVHEYRQRGYVYEDAHHALKTGQRGEIPQAASELIPTAPPTLIVSLRERISYLELELRQSHNEGAQSKGQVTLLKEQLEQKDRQIRELYKELAKLEVTKDSE